MIFSDLLKLARPYQYTKNLFIFAPAFFAFQLNAPALILRALLAFIGFSLIASAVYVFNDWVDRAEDAQHPEKCERPLAAGRITSSAAFAFVGIFIAGGVAYFG